MDERAMVFAMAGIVIAVFVISVCYARHYSHQSRFRERAGLDLPVRFGGSGRKSRGLDQQIIDSFPILVYSEVKELNIGTRILECAVCLNEFEDDETLRLIPECSHVFHRHCIDIWLVSHITCPVCRANLIPQPDDDDTSPVVATPILDASEPGPRSEHDLEEPSRDSIWIGFDQNRTMNLLNRSRTMNHFQPTRSSSTKFLFGILFPQSHSTGHSLVRHGENCDRFMLRLPEDVRKHLLNSRMNRSKSCVTFTGVSSGREGYRTRSMSSERERNYFQYERCGGERQSDGSGLTLTPPFFTRTISTRTDNRATTDYSESAFTMDNVGQQLREFSELWLDSGLDC